MKNQFPLMKKARQEGKKAFCKHIMVIIKERRTQRQELASGGVADTGDGTDGPVRHLANIAAGSGAGEGKAAHSSPTTVASVVSLAAVSTFSTLPDGGGNVTPDISSVAFGGALGGSKVWLMVRYTGARNFAAARPKLFIVTSSFPLFYSMI